MTKLENPKLGIHSAAPHLMIPGPTPLPYAVREAMGKPGIGHRSPEFGEVLKRVYPNLQTIFQTGNPVFVFTASGTAAMEAAMVNTLNRSDKLLVLVCGVFSGRWATMGEKLGMDVTQVTVDAGQANTLESLETALKQNSYKGVVLTHSETSTGVLNDIQPMLKAIKAHGALSYVDAVTSLGASPLPIDDWGADLVISGSQKGFMMPPGLSFLSVSDNAWKAYEECDFPGLYFDFSAYKKAQDGFSTPYTPATHLYMALDVSLQMMGEEGIEQVTHRHRHLRDMIRNGIGELGLSPFVTSNDIASDAVTSVRPPSHISVPDIRKGLKERFGITVANGQKDLKDKIFRIGHLGYQSERDVLTTLAALKAVIS
jgi:aspartate aminotransferase-like enzyme